jgi:hypothetical protein
VASAFIPLIHCTLTVLAMSSSSLDAPAGDRLDNEAPVCHTLHQDADRAL